MSPLEKLNQRVHELGLGVPVAIRVSPRARRLSLRVDAAARGVELVLPRRAPAEAALGFVARHRGWIAARIAAMPPPLRLVDGATVPVLGVPHRIRHMADRGAAPVTIVDGEIRVRGDTAHLPRRVIDHLKALARREFAARARTRCAARQKRGAGRRARPEKPLGQLLVKRRAVVQLAPHYGARAGDPLRRRTRGRTSGRDEPFAALLARRRGSRPRCPNRPLVAQTTPDGAAVV